MPQDPVPIRGLVALLIAYLTLPAVAALIAGSLMLRAQRAAQEAPPRLIRSVGPSQDPAQAEQRDRRRARRRSPPARRASTSAGPRPAACAPGAARSRAVTGSAYARYCVQSAKSVTGRTKPEKKTLASSRIIDSCTAWRSESATSEMSRPMPREANVSSSTIPTKASHPPSIGTPSDTDQQRADDAGQCQAEHAVGDVLADQQLHRGDRCDAESVHLAAEPLAHHREGRERDRQVLDDQREDGRTEEADDVRLGRRDVLRLGRGRPSDRPRAGHSPPPVRARPRRRRCPRPRGLDDLGVQAADEDRRREAGELVVDRVDLVPQRRGSSSGGRCAAPRRRPRARR